MRGPRGRFSFLSPHDNKPYKFIYDKFISLRKKIFMDSVAAKRQKMSKMSEPTQASSETQKIDPLKTSRSVYKEHYNSPYYVDKTLFMESFMKNSRILITAPPRFGKSLNMNMAKTFFEIELDEKNQPIVLEVDEDSHLLKDVQPTSKNFKLFEGKKIFKNKKFMTEHFGKYPVIYINFSDVAGDSFEQVLISFGTAIHKAFKEHEYLKNSSFINKKTFMRYWDSEEKKTLGKGEIKNGLPILARYLYRYYGRKVFVFIDEYDVFVNNMIYKNKISPKDRKSAISFIRKIDAIILKNNAEFVKKSLSNGCQQIGGILRYDANNIQNYPFMKPHIFSEFYGFSETEIEKLLKTVGKYEHFEKIKKHYNGYQMKLKDGRAISIYNPWAVIQYLKTEELSNKWSVGIDSNIRDAIARVEMRPKIMEILCYNDLKIKYTSKLCIENINTLHSILNADEIDDINVDIFMQFLYEQGFFYPVEFREDYLILAVPNEGVRAEIDSILSNIDAINKYYNHQPELIDGYITSLVSLAASCEKSKVCNLAKSIETLYEKTIKTLLNEFDFRWTLHAYIAQKFKMVHGECRTIENTKCDTVVVIEEHDVLFAIGVKLNKSAEMAHKQLVNRKYCTLSDDLSLAKLFPTMTSTIKNRIYLGINMDWNCKVTITYSLNGVESPVTVCSKDA